MSKIPAHAAATAQLTIEELVIRELGPALQSVVVEKLKGSYSGPLDKIIAATLTKHSERIEQSLNDALQVAVSAAEFQAALREQLTHKLARVVTGKMEGAIEKVANDIRSNPVFKSRLTIAVEQILRDLGNTIGVAR